MKIRSVKAQLFHAEGGETYVTKPIVAFRTATTPKQKQYVI